MKNDEVLISERIKELKEENAKLRDKVECLEDKLDVIKYIINESGYFLYKDMIEKILETLED